MGKIVWKKKRLSRTDKLEVQLSGEVRGRNRNKVSILLDRLHRLGVHQGFAVEDAKKFLTSGGERR